MYGANNAHPDSYVNHASCIPEGKQKARNRPGAPGFSPRLRFFHRFYAQVLDA